MVVIESAEPAASEPRTSSAPLPVVTGSGGDAARPRTGALDLAMSHFNARRYWHAYEALRTLVPRAPEDQREFLEGLTLVAMGLLHVQRRNVRLARLELVAGLARLRRYAPSHAGLVIAEVLDISERLIDQMDAGRIPSLIPPVIKYVEAPNDGPRP